MLSQGIQTLIQNIVECIPDLWSETDHMHWFLTIRRLDASMCIDSYTL